METEDFKDSKVKQAMSYMEEGNIEDALDCLYRWEMAGKNEGYSLYRLNHDKDDLENAFHDKWIEENLPRSGINGGKGILQDLMTHDGIEVTDRERKVVASIIQWLGTNVGRYFTEEVYKSKGYVIKKN